MTSAAKPGRPRIRKVLIAESQTLYRDALRALIERSGACEVVGLAADGLEAVQLHRQCRPDVTLLRAELRALNGVDVARAIVQDNPKAAILLISDDQDAWSAGLAFDVGARGFLFTSCPGDEVVRAIESIASGMTYLCPRGVDCLVQVRRVASASEQAILAPPPPGVLTPKERGVLQLIAEGFSTKEIAGRLEISLKTVETHRTNIMRKLALHNVARLTRYAVHHGLASTQQA